MLGLSARGRAASGYPPGLPERVFLVRMVESKSEAMRDRLKRGTVISCCDLVVELVFLMLHVQYAVASCAREEDVPLEISPDKFLCTYKTS